jgi:hypothetical protein
MFDSQQKSTGTQFTTTATLLIVAFILTPAALLFSRPVGYLSLALASACTAICGGLAWWNWKRYSEGSMPSIASEIVRPK